MKATLCKTSRLLGAALSLSVICLFSLNPDAVAADSNFGKPGEPIKLVVGYQPYATSTWSSVVMRSRKFYEKYLPKGSTVEFQIALQGPTIINNMASGRSQIGYLGDMPAIVATTRKDADLRLVGVISMSRSMCSSLIVRKDAPVFANTEAAVQWLNGKQIAAPKGSCADRFAQSLFVRGKVTPADYKSLNIETIASFMKDGKLDAAVAWEPTVARLVLDGVARRELTGAATNDQHGVFLAMRADLIRTRPDVVKAWLQAELDGQTYLLDGEKNAGEVVHMVQEQTAGIPEKTLWWSLYGTYTGNSAGEKARLQLPFAFTADVTTLLQDATAFLHQIKAIESPKLRPDAVMPEFAEEVLKARKIAAPLGEIRTQSDNAYRGN